MFGNLVICIDTQLLLLCNSFLLDDIGISISLSLNSIDFLLIITSQYLDVLSNEFGSLLELFQLLELDFNLGIDNAVFKSGRQYYRHDLDSCTPSMCFDQFLVQQIMHIFHNTITISPVLFCDVIASSFHKDISCNPYESLFIIDTIHHI